MKAGAIASCFVAALAAASACAQEAECPALAPCYKPEHITNSASYASEFLAPYTFATIWGTHLNRVGDPPRDRRPSDSGLAIGGVNVLVNGIPSMVFYVSETQVNFLVPLAVGPGDANIQLVRDSVAGPAARLRLLDWAPSLFLQPDPGWIRALRWAERPEDWHFLTEDAPARPGDYAILYATGLGDTTFPMDEYQPPFKAMNIVARDRFRLLLDGQPVEDRWIEYVGVAPPYTGLYQINFKVPPGVPANPLVRIAMGDRLSPEGPRIALSPEAPPASQGAAVETARH